MKISTLIVIDVLLITLLFGFKFHEYVLNPSNFELFRLFSLSSDEILTLIIFRYIIKKGMGNDIIN